MNLLAQELRAIDAELRGRRTPRDRAVAGYAAYKMRSWAFSVETGRPEAIRGTHAAAEAVLADAHRRHVPPFPWELDAYERAVAILERARAASSARLA